MMPQPDAAAGTAAPSAAARRARRLACAQALAGVPLGWDHLDACPDWLASPPVQRDVLAAQAGAWWLAAALRASIDGKRLACVRDLIGPAQLQALRASPGAARAEALQQAPRPLLPPVEDTPAYLLACGRALLAWSLPAEIAPALRQHLGWPVDEGHARSFDLHAAWAREALAAALNPPAAEDDERAWLDSTLDIEEESSDA